MAKAANTKLIGMFVLAGIGLIVAAIVIFGGGTLFRAVEPFRMYFTNSVQGLNVGSPVMFRGVTVGQVTGIELFFDPEAPNFLTQVDVNLFPDNYQTVGARKGESLERFDRLIEEGLRAQLIPISLVTGQLGIGLDMFPGSQAVLYAGQLGIPKAAGRLEIPTIPSTIERIETTVQRILAVFEKADFNQLSVDVEATLQSIRELMTMPELREMIVNANETVSSADATMKEVKTLVGRIDHEVGPSLTSMRTAMASAEATMGDARKLLPLVQQDLAQVGPLLDKLGGALTIAESLLKNANATIEPGSPLQYEIANTLRELSLTMRAVRGLTDALEQSPNSILFGRKTETSK